MMTQFEQVVQNVSNFSKCFPDQIPSVQEYLEATQSYGITLVSVGTVALLVTIVLSMDTLRYVMNNASSQVRPSTAFVIAVYPVICLANYSAILVPRSYLLAEAITQVMLMSGMYQLFCLFASYCGEDAQLIKRARVTRLSLKVGPCCCWPCCSLLPTFKVNEKTVQNLKLLVLQLPVVHGLVYFIILVMWAEGENVYQMNYLYLQPIIVSSIICGIWGMMMTIKLLNEILNLEFLLVRKFRVLKMVLIFSKAQAIITKALVWSDVLPCNPPLTPQVYINMGHSTLMIMEMVLLVLLARNLYKRKLPDSEKPCSKKNSIISTVFGDTQEKTSNINDVNGTENHGYSL